MNPPDLRIVSADELREAVGFGDLIEPVARALERSSAGAAASGTLAMYPAERPDRGDVLVKAGTIAGSEVYVVKVAPWFARNVERGEPQGGFVGVFDSRTGRTLALLEDEHHLSDVRTAAAGAVAARLLAPAEVDAVTVVGAGTQAYWQALALHRERPFRTLRIWARRSAAAEALAKRLRVQLPGVEVGTAENLERAVRAAQVVVTATQSREPLVLGEWLSPGQHVTAVGADDAIKCELDVAALRRSRVFVDSRKASAKAGDVRSAVEAGGYSLDMLAGELGDVVGGRVAGRLGPDDVTVAKLVGLGAQDVAAAETALRLLGLGGGG